MLRTIRVEGIIIKRINLGEADRIITILTKEFGKMAVKAGGVRKITSKRSPHIELLNYGVLTLYKGSKFPVLVEVQSHDTYSEIKSDLTKVGFAYHICELIDGLCPENQENYAVFNLTRHALERLCGDEDIVSVIHEFEIELLSLLGFWNRSNANSQLNTHAFIENILERKLKSRRMFGKMS
ncbi:hypothetical protein BH11PAT1_BH11PAT1_4070 [soil metagenome]